MSLFSLSGIIIVITSLGLFLMLSIYGRSKVHRLWAFFNIVVAIWGVGSFLVGRATSPEEALFAWRIGHSGAILIPVLFYHTIAIFTDKRKKHILVYAYIQAIVVLAFFLITNKALTNWQLLFNSLYYNRATLVYACAVASWSLIAFLAHYELVRFIHSNKGIKRLQASYIFWCFLIGFIGGASTLLPSFGLKIYPLGNFGIPIYCIVVTYAILKYRLMDIRVFISRIAAFLISYPFFLGLPFFFAYRMQPILYPIWGMNWWLAPAGLLLFFATLSPLAYGQIRGRMENVLLAEQKRYQKLLLQAAGGMVAEHNLGRLAKLIVYIVKRIVKIDFTAIFLDNEKTGAYKLQASRSSRRSFSGNINFPYDNALIKHLRAHKEPFIYEELPSSVRNSLGAPGQISMIVPSYIEDELLGFIFLGEKINRQAYTEDDINVFKILSHQAALAIKNCLFLEESKQAQERIFTAEKLASIGGMADGVAHQIKNRLNQFSVASGELKYEVKDFIDTHPELVSSNPDLKKSFDYITKIGESLIANVKKTDGIVKGILQFARVEEKETFFSRFSLKEVIDLSEGLLKVKHEVASIPLVVQMQSSDIIYGVKAQITEAIYNILDNAFEAIQEKRQALDEEDRKKFTPFIKVVLTHESGFHRIEISDNGIGIKKEDRQKIFAPFFTTKSSYKSGTGIGMYVVKRMVEENHKGRVSFSTEYMQGTRFLIDLPEK